MMNFLHNLKRIHFSIWIEREPKWVASKYLPLPSSEPAMELRLSKTNIAEFLMPKGTK